MKCERNPIFLSTIFGRNKHKDLNQGEKDMPEDKAKYLQRIIDSIGHPFYVVDVKNYLIRFANKACGFDESYKNSTCYQLTHKCLNPCSGEHICPLERVIKTKQPVKTEHIHYDKEGKPRIMEVHGDPVFDEKGNLIMMIEYSFDITELKKAQDELAQKLEQVEKFNKAMVGREVRVLELKKEINDLLVSFGKSPKYPSEE